MLDAVADAMTYLSLVAAAAGCDDLEKLLGDTFNMVSERAGSKIRTTLGGASGIVFRCSNTFSGSAPITF